MLRRLARSGGTSARRAPRDASEGPAPPSPEPRGGKGGVVPLDERRRANAEGASPSVTPSSSGDGSVTPGKPGSFGYKHQEVDSSSSLGDLNEVAEFVVPERVPEKIPHKATGALPTRRVFAIAQRRDREISRGPLRAPRRPSSIASRAHSLRRTLTPPYA